MNEGNESQKTAENLPAGEIDAGNPAAEAASPASKPRRRRRRRRRPGSRHPEARTASPGVENGSELDADDGPETREGETELKAQGPEPVRSENHGPEPTEEDAGAEADGQPQPAHKSRRRRRRRRNGNREARPADQPAAENQTTASAPEAGSALNLVAKADTAGPTQTAADTSRMELDLRSSLRRDLNAQKLLKFPGLDTGRARKLLIQFIRDEMERREAAKTVIGLSGGLSSAVVAGLAIEALGKDRVHLVHFVEHDKGSPQRVHADLVARLLHAPLDILDLRAHLGQVLPRHQESLDVPHRRRLMRERAAALYEICESKPGCVLLGTLDKTKWLLGLGVEGATLEFAFNPLGDLYRHQVRELGRAMGVPREIMEQEERNTLDAEAMAEKKTGWSWQDIDYYLYQMVDAKIALSYLLFLGLEEDKLRWTYRRLRDSAHQRKLAPVAEAVAAYALRNHPAVPR